MLKLIITGTGRCGTGYMATVLNRAGVKTSHEKVFTPLGPQPTHDYEVCVSWMAVPYLYQYDCYKVGIWRDKELVVNSMKKRDMFDKGDVYDKFALHHGSRSPEHHWRYWNRRLLSNVNEYHHISNMTGPVICNILGKAGIEFDRQSVIEAVSSTPNNINS